MRRKSPGRREKERILQVEGKVWGEKKSEGKRGQGLLKEPKEKKS